MKFQWVNAWGWETDIAKPQDVWTLFLMGNHLPVKRMGTLTKVRGAWRVLEHRVSATPDKYWLDGDLSLEDAQRAAKLFLCVGRQT